MKTTFTESGDTAVVSREGFSIRMAYHNGKTVFCLRDIFAVSGRGVKINAGVKKEIQMEKIPYPYWTKKGLRKIPMFFIGPEEENNVYRYIGNDAETKKWLHEEVFSRRIEKSRGETTEEKPNAQKEDFIDLIDRALLDLMRIKCSILS